VKLILSTCKTTRLYLWFQVGTRMISGAPVLQICVGGRDVSRHPVFDVKHAAVTASLAAAMHAGCFLQLEPA
jgi:hypothetical protein